MCASMSSAKGLPFQHTEIAPIAAGPHVTSGSGAIPIINGQVDQESQRVSEPVKWKWCGKVAAGATKTSCGLALGVVSVLLALYLGRNYSGHPATISARPAVLPGPPCNSEQCHALSVLYNKSLSQEYKPCDDFYEHVCTGWTSDPSSISTSVLLEQALRMRKSTIGVLRNTSVPLDSQTAVQKVAGLFQSCVDLFGDEERATSGQNPSVDIAEFLREHNASFEAKSDVDPAHMMLDFAITYGLPTLFNIRLDTIPENAERLHVILSARRFLNIGEWASDEGIVQHLRWLGLDDNIVRKLTPKIAAIEVFLIMLCRRTYENEETDETERSVLLLRTMEKAILRRKGDNWNYYLGNITNGLLPGDHYVVFETRYLVVFLANVFRMFTDPNDLRIWMSFDLSRQLRKLVKVSRTGSVQMGSTISQRESHCLKHTFEVMAKAAYAAFYYTSVTSDTISEAQEMVSSIADSLKTQVAESSWIEDSTREIAVRKLVKMKKVVGYPEGAEDDDSLNKYYEAFDNAGPSFVNNWLSASRLSNRKAFERLSEHPIQMRIDDDMAMVNAIYYPPLNTMVVGMGLLLPPFFGTVPAVDYASAGHLAAHEMMHAFDIANRHRDHNYVEGDWWSPASKAEYEKRVMCIRNSLEEELSELDDVIDSEIMADFIGLSGLHDAYLKAKQVPDASLELQGLPGVTSDQLFFIAFCYKWCSNVRASQRYPEFNARCNMPLMNTPQFAEAFNCSAGARMNPREKCAFW
ncbi:hypothetical protein MTO96_030672 [Rhipicephalus appendiculatus]